jgi:hypothetical protein
MKIARQNSSHRLPHGAESGDSHSTPTGLYRCVHDETALAASTLTPARKKKATTHSDDGLC